MRNRLLERLESASNNNNNNHPAGPSQTSSLSSSSSHSNLVPTPEAAGRLSSSSSSSTSSSKPQMPPSPGSPPTLSLSRGESSLSRAGRSFRAQSISAVRLRKDKDKDKDKDKSFSKKDRGGLLSPGLSSLRSSESSGAASLAMNRQAPTYASMPGAPHHHSTYSQSPPRASAVMAGPSISAIAGSSAHHAYVPGSSSSLSHPIVAPSSAPPHQHHPNHLHSHQHEHHHHHNHQQGRSAEDEERIEDTEDSFFAHLRMECEDCHEILDSEAVLDGKSPRRRSNLPLPAAPAGADHESSELSIPLEDRGGLLLGVGTSSSQGRLQSMGSAQSNMTVTSARMGEGEGLSPSQTLRGEPRAAHDDGDVQETVRDEETTMKGEDRDGDGGEEYGYEQEQVLGGFASLGVQPGKSGVGTFIDWDSASSAASQGRRSRTNTGPQQPGSEGLTSGGIFSGSLREEGEPGTPGFGPPPVDARMSWPSSLRTRNADPMETLDILSIEEMGMHSVNMGNPDDWEGCIIGPVRPDAPPSSLKFASPAEFCAPSAAITWGVARYVGHPRKWIVAPLQALRPCEDPHLAACNTERTVVVTDHHVSLLQRSGGLAANEPNFWDQIPVGHMGFSYGAENTTGGGGGSSMAMAASSTVTGAGTAGTTAQNASSAKETTTPFNETTVFELRFLRANAYEAVLTADSPLRSKEGAGAAAAEVPVAPEAAFVLASPDMHRAMAKAAMRSASLNAAKASVSSLSMSMSGVGMGMGGRAHTVGVHSGSVSGFGSGAKSGDGHNKRGGVGFEAEFGWTDPFVDAAAAAANSARGSTGSGSTRHGGGSSQAGAAGRASASLLVSSGLSSRSGGSVVGLGLGGSSSSSNAEYNQLRAKSVAVGAVSGPGVSAAVSALAPVSIPRTMSTHNTILASSAAATGMAGYPAALTTTASTAAAAASSGKRLRQVRSKPALRGPQMRDVMASQGQGDTSNPNTHAKRGTASASSSPLLHPSPRTLQTGTSTGTGVVVVPSPAAAGSIVAADHHHHLLDGGAAGDSRRPSLGKSASFESASTTAHPRAAANPFHYSWGSGPGTGPGVGVAASSGAGSTPNSPMLSATRPPPPAHQVELLGLDAAPRRSLTMIIPLPLFQLESAPRPVMRYVRITFVPFASANAEEGDAGGSSLQRVSTNEKGGGGGFSSHSHNHSHSHGHGHGHKDHKEHQHGHHHLFQSKMRLPASLSQSSGLSMAMPDDFELPMSPLLTPTATMPPPLNLAPAHPHSHLHPQPPQPQSQPPWYRKFAAAAGARGLLHIHDDGPGGGSSSSSSTGTGTFSLGGGNGGGGNGEGSKDWFKRIGSRQHEESVLSPTSPSPPPHLASSVGMSKGASHLSHDRCRLPGRRREVAEAFRVTALVLGDVPLTSTPAAGVGAGAVPMGVTRTASAGSAVRRGFQPGSLPLLSAMSGRGAAGGGQGQGQGQGYISSHVSPRHVQGAFPGSAASTASGGAESPSLSEAGSTHHNQHHHGGLASTLRSRGSDSGASFRTTSTNAIVDWSADLPERGTFPVVLAFCDGSRSRSLELVPEGWEAIGLGSGASALGLPGLGSGLGDDEEAEEEMEEETEGGGGGQQTDGDGFRHGGTKRARAGLPGGALGGVADLILAACSAVMDL
ncbi:hypothetical protein A4X06_0g4385 [Tilletia controversa]|uniref:Uncharacterized protein n=1 Tax=Tilletia controversa TaxID=13291 RepID=A0A8X7MTU1_9BASI|nr:hypothetical protein A4X06_0g4385 [Tilletia controversa]